MSKNVVIVANFFETNNASRPYMAYNYFLSKGYTIKVYYALFSHSLKKDRLIRGEHFYPVKIMPYTSNISIKRIFSHLDFLRKVNKLLKNESPDIVYFNVPPNMLGIPLVLLKRQKGYQLITDVLDIWPEAFPFPKSIKRVFNITFGWWLKQAREFVLKHADYIITESDYFYRKMNLDRFRSAEVIYLKKMDSNHSVGSTDISQELSFSYIGNIGSIYDFDSLLKLLEIIKDKRPVSLEIIGEGNRKDWLLNELNKKEISFTFHGATFDESIKQKVIGRSWFGYNGFKDSTEVALSYKSIDYFSFGVPILNSAKGDTYDLIESFGLGINFTASRLEELSLKLLTISREDALGYRKIVSEVFKQKFSEQSYAIEMDSILNQLV